MQLQTNSSRSKLVGSLNNPNKLKLYTLQVGSTNFDRIKVNDSNQAQQFIRQFYSDDLQIYESFFILLLNRNNKTIGYAKISQGGITGTVVDTKIICKYAIDALASGVILCHNHPSGNTHPSDADLQITDKVKKALLICDTNLLDHIILTSESFYSFADNGRI